MRVTIRQYRGLDLVSQETTDMDETTVKQLSKKHGASMLLGECDSVEIEFLDEPDPLTRFLRIGTNPVGMTNAVRFSDPEDALRKWKGLL